MKYFVLAFLLLLTSGCSTLRVAAQHKRIIEKPEVQESPLSLQLKALPPIDGPTMTVAVYRFEDKTGQRKTATNLALFSSAVTQGAESWLIDSLQQASYGKWFKVLERANLDDLIKERTLYRQTREDFLSDKTPGALRPMLFAGVIAEGGIIGYDTDVQTGGYGASILGIGANVQYSKDVITTSLRLVSTNTGEVLISVAVTKTIYSATISGNALAFSSDGTKYGEAELGAAGNEPVNLALRAAIDQSVIELIHQGEHKGLWKFKVNGSNNFNSKK